MNLLKVLLGVNALSHLGFSRKAKKTQGIVKQGAKDLFILSQLVVELTTLVATILVFAYKLLANVVKYIAGKIHKVEVVKEENKEHEQSNIIKLEEYKNRKVG